MPTWRHHTSAPSAHRSRSRRERHDGRNDMGLQGLGIFFAGFFGGLGIFFAGIGVLWHVSLRRQGK